MSTPWKVGAMGHQMVPWFVVLPDNSSVADLTRAVEARQNKLLHEGPNSSKITVGIKLKVDEELYAVDPDDVLLNLVPKGRKGPMFVAVRTGGGSVTCTAGTAAGAAGPAALAAAEARAAVAAAAAAATPHYGTPSTRSPTQLQLSSIGTYARRGTPTSTGWRPKLPSPAASGTMVDNRKTSAAAKTTTTTTTTTSRSDPCEACSRPLDTNRRPSFCCRTCRKVFHSVCVGYDPRKRQSPPPDWICPHCPGGERGPVERIVHPSLKKKGSVNQKRGNQQWCAICLDDNRVPGTGTMGCESKRCPSCGLHAHAGCRIEIPPHGRWPCDECQRRRDGVVPGNNPVWLRLKAARLDGGFARVPTFGASIPPSTVADAASPSLSKRALSGAAVTPPIVTRPAVSPPAATGPPNHLNQLSFSSIGAAAWSSDAEEAAAATAAVAAAAASFLPPQCLPSLTPSLASASSASTTVPSSPPTPFIPPLSSPPTQSLPTGGSSVVAPSPATPAAAPTIKTEEEGPNGSNDDEEDVKPRRYPKRAKMATSDYSQKPGQPQFRHEFDWQPAENAVLAPIMLYGPPEQQHFARAFISTKFNKDTPEACESLIAKLKETVKQDDEGTWVHRLKLIEVCNADDDIVRYLLGANTQDSYRRVTNKFKILANFSSWPGSRSQLYTHDEDFDHSRYFILRE